MIPFKINHSAVSHRASSRYPLLSLLLLPLPPTLTTHHLPPTYPLSPHHLLPLPPLTLPPTHPFPRSLLNPTYHAVSFKRGEHHCCLPGPHRGGDASKGASLQHLQRRPTTPSRLAPRPIPTGLVTARVARGSPGRRSPYSAAAAMVWTSPASPHHSHNTRTLLLLCPMQYSLQLWGTGP